VVEQQELLVQPASHVATAALASTGGASAAAASTCNASAAAPTTTPAVGPAAERWKASVRWAPAIGNPATLHWQATLGGSTTLE
jgi:hypothetical protein